MIDLSRIFPDGAPPKASGSIALGRDQASETKVGDCAFLSDYNVRSELEYKQQARKSGRIMSHAQIGWRDPSISAHGWSKIHRAVSDAGGCLDRYGICLDWSMGYPKAARGRMGRGTGLILEEPEDFRALTHQAPVAPHFGDFVIGLPAALENTICALGAGATSIGNLGQYFTFRMPGWGEDRETTAATVAALALCAAQPVPIIIHSNLDDGFAAQFVDLACAFGAVLLERYIVEDLIGGTIGHCYGHTFSDLTSRMAFQQALAAERDQIPGTMVYGNTTAYRENVSDAENYGALAAYLALDIAAQRTMPSGHAITPIPVTEADRIPDIDEVVDAQLFAVSLIRRTNHNLPNLDREPAETMARTLRQGGQAFFESVLAGLESIGLDIRDPEALLLGLRRVGAKRLEELFGPGAANPSTLRGRVPLVVAPPVAEIAALSKETIAVLDQADRDLLTTSDLTVAVASTDVHEFGKLLAEQALADLNIRVLDAGIHAEPDELAILARDEGVQAIALGTYNGVAIDYADALRRALTAVDLDIPIFVGGKLNQIRDDSNSSLPVDVTEELRARGLTPCARMEDMLIGLVGLVRNKDCREDTT